MEEREKVFQERIKECDRQIEMLRREYEKINSSNYWDEFINYQMEDLYLNYPI